MATVTTTPPVSERHITAEVRPVAQASRSAFVALLQRDLTVLRKNLGEFVTRTLVQPFLLVFVFLYVFPTIGQGVGSGGGRIGESAFATVLVPGVVGISIMFQGIQAVAMTLSQEFGFTREIEDRVQAPCPVWLVAVGEGGGGRRAGRARSAIVLPDRVGRAREGSGGASHRPLVDPAHRPARRRASRSQRSACSSARSSSPATSA